MDSPSPLRALLERYPDSTPPSSAAGAAVTIVLREGRTDVEALLIERAMRDEDPASGQIGLPGGHVDSVDQTLRDTALRELEEEVGLGVRDLNSPPRFVQIQDAPRFRLKVGVFAAELSSSPPPTPSLSPKEVASVFWFPRSALDSRSRVSRETPLGAREVDAVLFDRHILWGFTLRVLSEFFARDGAP